MRLQSTFAETSTYRQKRQRNPSGSAVVRRRLSQCSAFYYFAACSTC